MPANYFDERIAKSYAAKWPDLFEPAMVEPCVRHNCRIRGDLQPQNCYGKTVIASISSAAWTTAFRSSRATQPPRER